MRVSGGTRILAVAGDPVAHSLSPVMHNAAIAALGLDAVYVAARTTAEAFPALVQAMLAAGGALNVTAPFKFQAAGLVEDSTEAVRLTGACNTIWGDADHANGDNTDIAGIRAAVRALMDGKPVNSASVFGTGATARSAAVAVYEEWPNAVISVHSREHQRARAFVAWAEQLGVRALVQGEAGTPPHDLLINTTPVDEPPPHAEEAGAGARARPRLPVAYLDLKYARGEPVMVRTLRGLGVRTADGRGVLVAQGAASFERFFGVRPPLEIMRAAVEDALRP